MALLFIDGFDHYVTADMLKKWSSKGAGSVISASAGRRGGGALSIGGSNQNTTKTFAQTSAFVIGAAINLAQYANAGGLFYLYDGASQQCQLVVNVDGTLSVTRAGTALTGGTSTNMLTLGAWNYIEWKVTIADSIAAGSCKVRVNGVDWITVAAGQDLKATANAYATALTVGAVSGSGNLGASYLDDFYLCDQSGSLCNDFLGDCRVDAQYPTSDGNYSQFTPSTGTTHYTLVDETAPNTTDHNSGTALNQIDSYGMGNLGHSPLSIFGVQVNLAALKSDAGARGITPLIRSGTTDSLGTELALSTSQIYARSIWETDPATASPWTESGVNAIEAGAKVTT